MSGESPVSSGLEELSRLAHDVGRILGQEIEDIAELTIEALRGGGRLFFCGNGGSAADAQHLAAEYVVRFGRDRPALPAFALTTDSSVLTAAANDLGYEAVFARQIEALCAPGDVLFLHSTSGESPNLLRAAEAGTEKGVVTVGMLARGGGRLAGVVDHCLIIPTDSTARAQEIHMAIGHAICERVEEVLSGSGRHDLSGP